MSSLESDKASDPWHRRYRGTAYCSRALARTFAEKQPLAAVAEDLGGAAESVGAREHWFGGRVS